MQQSHLSFATLKRLTVSPAQDYIPAPNEPILGFHEGMRGAAGLDERLKLLLNLSLSAQAFATESLGSERRA